MKNVFVRTVIGLLGMCVGMTVSAQSIPSQGTWTTTLQARDLDGNLANGPEAYYDSALNITWMANANLGKGSVYDTQDSNGAITWNQAQTLVTDLSVGGVTGWRLPKVSPVNGIDWQYYSANDWWTGSRDQSYNIVSKNSEMAYMFHVELGNKSIVDTSGNDQEGYGITNAGPFSSYDAGWGYWFGTSFDQHAGDPRYAPASWLFYPDFGSQGWAKQENLLYAWAVHDGDVGAAIAPVPEPETYQLMLAGLVGLAAVARRRQRLASGRVS
ncbi:PEP-CTERM sorting domain-containing protein [Paucibacter sp. R3-3]|uniref:PEP-CTERM sorting domain-containing protein n=1 Tax=Roseateles agri TaxID=3098619 RepID=A0ABU5DD39_9BURK|nr:PEP-CTERM sorting domain-containing protein [Paucibacter sp. R3-3]MDY0744201.1 PEP-CTERM sorting domain-containing protein [Paucibacter sp. R3-3]